MDGLDDGELETVFRFCDVQVKGYVNATDLRAGLAHTLGDDVDAAEHILEVLGLGRTDTLSLPEFIRRVRGVYDTAAPSCPDPPRYLPSGSPSSFGGPHRSLSSLARNEGPLSESTFGEELATLSDVFFSPSSEKSEERPLSAAAPRGQAGSVFSSEGTAPLETCHGAKWSSSISDLTEKVGDLKEMLSENDEGLKEVLRRLFGTLSKDLDRRFESLFFNLEEKWSLQNSQQHEKELSKYRQEKLEHLIEKLTLENAILKERVDDFNRNIAAKDSSLKNQHVDMERLNAKLAAANEAILKLEDLNRQHCFQRKVLEKKLEKMRNACGHLQSVFFDWDDFDRPSSEMRKRGSEEDIENDGFDYKRRQLNCSFDEEKSLSEEIAAALSNEVMRHGKSSTNFSVENGGANSKEISQVKRIE